MSVWYTVHKNGELVGTVEADTLLKALKGAKRKYGAPLKVKRP